MKKKICYKLKIPIKHLKTDLYTYQERFFNPITIFFSFFQLLKHNDHFFKTRDTITINLYSSTCFLRITEISCKENNELLEKFLI